MIINTWRTRTGANIPIQQLSDQHLTNILRQLQRAAEIKRLALISVYESMPNLTGDVEAHFNQMYDQLIDQCWRDLVDDIFQPLELEAARRKLKWDLFENRPLLVDEIDLSKYGQVEALVTGALRDCIQTHGNITKDTVPSATKRVMGAIRAFNKRKK